MEQSRQQKLYIALEDLLRWAGHTAALETEQWRIEHPALMDAIEYGQEVLEAE